MPAEFEFSTEGNKTYIYDDVSCSSAIAVAQSTLLFRDESRMLSPSTTLSNGIFTRDPIGYWGSPFNLYEWIKSRGVNNTDPSGLAIEFKMRTICFLEDESFNNDYPNGCSLNCFYECATQIKYRDTDRGLEDRRYRYRTNPPRFTSGLEKELQIDPKYCDPCSFDVSPRPKCEDGIIAREDPNWQLVNPPVNIT